ncbi:MAG: hypothetical protein HYY13_04505 [Nitrospirae bacterium]|nr:hypothetical protein [Nitrospirota bacterium]
MSVADNRLVERTVTARETFRLALAGWLFLGSVLAGCGSQSSGTGTPRVDPESTPYLLAGAAEVVAAVDEAISALDSITTSNESVDSLSTAALGLEGVRMEDSSASSGKSSGGKGGKGSPARAPNQNAPLCNELKSLESEALRQITRGLGSLPLTLSCRVVTKPGPQSYEINSLFTADYPSDPSYTDGRLVARLNVPLGEIPLGARSLVAKDLTERTTAQGFTCDTETVTLTCSRQFIPFCAEPETSLDTCAPVYLGKRLDPARVKPGRGYLDVSKDEARSFMEALRSGATAASSWTVSDAAWITRIDRRTIETTEQTRAKGASVVSSRTERTEIVSHRFSTTDAAAELPAAIRAVVEKEDISWLDPTGSTVLGVALRYRFEGAEESACEVRDPYDSVWSASGKAMRGGSLELGSQGSFAGSESAGCRAYTTGATEAEKQMVMSVSETVHREFASPAEGAAEVRPVSEVAARRTAVRTTWPIPEGETCPGAGEIRVQSRVTFSDGHSEEREQRLRKKDKVCEPVVKAIDGDDTKTSKGDLAVDEETGKLSGRVRDVDVEVSGDAEGVREVKLSRVGSGRTVEGTVTLHTLPGPDGVKGRGNVTITTGGGARVALTLTIGSEGIREARGTLARPDRPTMEVIQTRGREGYSIVARELGGGAVSSASPDAAGQTAEVLTELRVTYRSQSDAGNTCEVLGEGEFTDFRKDRDAAVILYEDGSVALIDAATGQVTMGEGQSGSTCADRASG